MESLTNTPFSYEAGKSGVVRIFRSNRLAITLRGSTALQFLAKIEYADTASSQKLMAKITGQFKFGNERKQGTSSK